MGYMKIDNLYKNTEIIDLFRECYAMEKIHGTSAHVKCQSSLDFPNGHLSFFSGGEKYDKFIKLWNHDDLLKKFQEYGDHSLFDGITLFGEAYGGSQQRMAETYGPDLKFIVFDVKIGDYWLSVPKAAKVAENLGFEFVHWVKGPATLEFLNKWRDADSTQAIRNGMGPGKMREGIVVRPLQEFRSNGGKRIIVKHKRDDFRETKTPREVDPEKLKVLTEAREIAREWVTLNRLKNILSHLSPDISIKDTGLIVKKMQEDVKIEAQGEIVWSKAVEKEIGKAAAILYKSWITTM